MSLAWMNNYIRHKPKPEKPREIDYSDSQLSERDLEAELAQRSNQTKSAAVRQKRV